VFLDAGAGAVLEVPMIASKARGVNKPTRHDKDAARKLDAKKGAPDVRVGDAAA
jgi:hypothetical protein